MEADLLVKSLGAKGASTEVPGREMRREAEWCSASISAYDLVTKSLPFISV